MCVLSEYQHCFLTGVTVIYLLLFVVVEYLFTITSFIGICHLWCEIFKMRLFRLKI